MIRWALRSPDIEHLTRDTPPAAEGEALLDQIAAAVVRRRLAAPAVFFLELNRPLTFLAGQATHVLVPFLAPLVGLGRMQEIARLLNDPESVDRLLEWIERLEKEPAPEEESTATA